MKHIKQFFSYKIYAWVLLLFVLVIGIAWLTGLLQVGAGGGSVSVSSSVQYIEKVQETVFLNVGVQKVVKASSSNAKILGLEIPQSKKTALLVLNYKAKFGIKEAVVIKKTGDKAYQVQVPTFEVIGFEWDEENGYELYDRDGELLSGLTDEVDTGKLVTQETSTKKQKAYIAQYQKELEESATHYYKQLFQSIDPDIELTVIFD